MTEEDLLKQWYLERSGLYSDLCKKIETLLIEVLKSSKVEYHSVTSRTKEVDRFLKKVREKKYKDPKKDIKDLCGIRIITYTIASKYNVSKILEKEFDIDPNCSVDKSKELGTNKVGYRSIHLICTLSKKRTDLSEYERFKDLCFEIQIGTILEHAWAEVEHDRNYKFSGVLPEEVQRRFSLLAGSLESADKELDGISKEIDAYDTEVTKKTKAGDLSIEINTTSLRSYLHSKFGDLLKLGIEPTFGGLSGVLIEELNSFGIDKIEDLDKIISSDFIDKYTKILEIIDYGNWLGFVRSIMLSNDAKKYFEKAWNKQWNGLTLKDVETCNILDIDIIEIGKKYGLYVDESLEYEQTPNRDTF